MARPKRRFRPLAELLARLSREPGAGRLRRATLEAGVERALGAWLAERVRSCRRDGDRLELEIDGAAAAAQVRELADEVLLRLREELGRDAPARVRIRATPESARSRRSGFSSPPAPGPTRGPGPRTAEALEGVDDADLRERLARVAARGTRPGELEGTLPGG